MKRREFITLLGGGAAAAWPLASRAQQGERVRRIGVLTALDVNDPQVKVWLTSFEDGLQKLGWDQGRNLTIDYRWPGGDEGRLQTYAAELVRMAPDVLFAAATPALVALQRETRSLPIVFVQVSDPVRLGFVASLARPGGNMTGFTNFEYSIGGKWLELLKDTAPATNRVAIIFDPDNPSQAQYVQGIEAGAPSFGMQLTLAAARNAGDVRTRHRGDRAAVERRPCRGAEHGYDPQPRHYHRACRTASVAGGVSVSFLRQQRGLDVVRS
jgi:putative ABC transport system substrate-binding protein